MFNPMPLNGTFIDSVMDRSSRVAPYAHRLYSRARWAHQRKQLLARLTGQDRRLFTLDVDLCQVGEPGAGCEKVPRFAAGESG